MSKYTTEVRYVCESKSGLEVSGGANDVDEIIAKSWNKIFTSKVAFFDEKYRSVLCQKILKHYYLREICCETVGIWTLWMNTRLEEIMPYYNKLYESAKIEFNPMHDVNLTRKHDRNVEGTTEENGTRTDNATSNSTSNTSATKKDLYSDTPQGAITNLENESYLTNARKVTDSIDGTGSETSNATGVTNNTGSNNTTESYLESVVGKQGTESFSKLLNEYRDTFINIDMQVINEFSDLFFGLW